MGADRGVEAVTRAVPGREPYTPVGVYVVRWIPVGDAPITFGPFVTDASGSGHDKAERFAAALPQPAGYEISAVFPPEDMRGSGL